MIENKVKKGDFVVLKIKRAGATFVNFERSAGYVEFVIAEVTAAKRDGTLKEARTATHTFRIGDWAQCFALVNRQAEARVLFATSPEPWGNIEDLKLAFTCQHTDYDEDQNGNTQCRRCALKIEAKPEPKES